MGLRKPREFRTAFHTYVATDVIGNGGSGEVYKATNEEGGPRAIKLLSGDQKNKRKRFENELRFCMNEHHPGIIWVTDHGLCEDGKTSRPFYVMPLYGGSLRNLMGGTMSGEEILRYFGKMLDAVEAAHLKGVIHRDIKPENLLYGGEASSIVLADFGIAHFQEEELWTSVETKEGERLANFVYRAPEQLKRGGQADARSDIFALGRILNEMFTGHVPDGTGYPTIGKSFPDYEYLDRIVENMIAYEPDQRPQSIEVIKQQLIGRKNEFIERQRLSKLKNKVVSVMEPENPLIEDPPRVIDAKWDKGRLTLTLSRSVDEIWKSTLSHIDYKNVQMGMEPNRFVVHNDQAMIDVQGHDAQKAVEYFKSWLPQVDAKYKETVTKALEEKEREARLKLQAEIKAAEERLKVNSSLRI